jgi:hypothetical protein
VACVTSVAVRLAVGATPSIDCMASRTFMLGFGARLGCFGEGGWSGTSFTMRSCVPISFSSPSGATVIASSASVSGLRAAPSRAVRRAPWGRVAHRSIPPRFALYSVSVVDGPACVTISRPPRFLHLSGFW